MFSLFPCVLLIKGISHTYSCTGWPGILAFKGGPRIYIRNGQEFGDLGMCHHLRLRFSQNTHGHRVSKYASNNLFLQARLLSNIPKGDLATRRYHIRNIESADYVNDCQVRDLGLINSCNNSTVPEGVIQHQI